MKYIKRYKGEGFEPFEITREEARRNLEGFWQEEALEDIFDNDRAFRLWTPTAEIWTKTDDGMVPMAGFYGVI